MPGRIRNIKPELREMAEFSQLTDGAARLFTMLYTLADDEGVCPAGASFLAGAVFFGRPRTPASIGRLLAELEHATLIQRHTVSGSPFISIVGWSVKGHVNYQFIKKPNPFRYCAHGTIRSTPQSPPESPPKTTPSDSADHSDSAERSARLAKAPQEEPQIPSSRPGEIAFDHNDPRSRGRFAEHKYNELSRRRIALAKRHGWPIPFPLPDSGGGGNETAGFRDLRDRIREEGALAPQVLDAIFEVLEQDDVAGGRLHWLDERSFKADAWRNARGRASLTPAKKSIADEPRLPARPVVMTVSKTAMAIFGDDELDDVLAEVDAK